MTTLSRSNVILRNIASNWIGYVINAAVTLFLTPFVLNELGTARYGIWILTSSFVGYYGFLDLGFRAGLTQYLTRYISLRDYAKASECVSCAVVALSLLGTLMIGLSIGGAYIAPYLFDIPLDSRQEAFWCILIVGISSSIQVIYSPYAPIFTALQRFDLSNLIGIGARLLSASGVFAALKLGYGLIGISVAFCGVNVIEYLIRWQVANWLAPDLNVSLRRSNFARLREIASFGGWNFIISINGYIFTYVPSMIIGAFMPIAAVGYYALAMGLIRNISSVLTPIAQVLYPVAVEVNAKGDRNELVRLYHYGSRFMMLIMISTVLMATFWAEDFYRLWVGEMYVSGAYFHSVALILQILLICIFTTYVSCISSLILIGSGRVRPVAMAVTCGSILNLTFSLILIKPYGLLGIAAATVIASVIIDLITIPMLLRKFVGLSLKDFLFKACLRPLATGAIQVIVILIVRSLGKPPDWTHLVLHGILAGAGLLATAIVIGLTTDERETYVIKPWQRLFRSVSQYVV